MIIFEEEECTSYYIEKCKYDPDDFIDSIYVKTREKCQASCNDDYPDKCKTFIFDRLNERCDLLKLPLEDYMKTCKLYGGPTTGSVANCLPGISTLYKSARKWFARPENCKVS